ncbi:WD40-repeat-containing domain protein, partial [Suillus occidentalis]
TGDENGELIAWHAKTGESLAKVKVHGSAVRSLDFSPDDSFVATASSAPNDQKIRFWNTKTWAQYPGTYDCGSTVRCVRYARSGVYMLAVATDRDIQIYVAEKLQAKFKGHSHGTLSLAWSPDRTRLFSGGDDLDPSIREWDTSSWSQVGLPWKGHTYKVNSIAVNSFGTHAVSASSDNSVRLWQLSDQTTVAVFQHTSSVVCAVFSADGAHILSGGYDKKITDWKAPKGILPSVDASNKVQEPAPKWQSASKVESHSKTGSSDFKSLHAASTAASSDLKALQASSTIASSDFNALPAASTTASPNPKSLQAVSATTTFTSKSQQPSLTVHPVPRKQSVSTVDQFVAKSGQFVTTSDPSVTKSEQLTTKSGQPVINSEQIDSKTLVITADDLLAITKTIRIASMAGDLITAEKVLTQEITADTKNFASYANRSFVMARKLNWENALQDANKSLAVQTSLAGYIAKGIALCGKQLVEDARTAFDLAFTLTHGNMDATVFLYFIKAIALFNANRHKEAVLRVEELASDPSADPLACGVVVANLRVQLGTIAFNGAHHSEAIEHFTAAVKASTFLAKSSPPAACEAFTVLFGWDNETLWQTSNKKLILALLGAGRLGEAFESYRFAMDASNETTKASLHPWVLSESFQ